MYKDMDRWTEIRKKILVEGVSKRQVMEEEGIHWETLKKILANAILLGARRRDHLSAIATATTNDAINNVQSGIRNGHDGN